MTLASFNLAAPRAVLLLLLVTGAVDARSHGYIFFGPGGVTSRGNTSGAMYLGGGGEVVFGPGIGLGMEIGYTALWRHFRSGIGIGSANGSFHLRRAGQVVPFVAGGYTLFFRSGHANGLNLGGGVNWWFRDRLGFRMEFRDHIGFGGLSEVHFWSSAQV